MNVKQVIVMRRDLKMRRGKEIAQGAHAACAFLSRSLRFAEIYDRSLGRKRYSAEIENLSPAAFAWLTGAFTKITVYVNSEAELMEVHDKALAAGLTVSLITDAGKTEFNGVPTRTCLAIGPDLAEDIDKVTGELKLY